MRNPEQGRRQLEQMLAAARRGGRRGVDVSAMQDAVGRIGRTFDALDAVLAAMGPIRQDLDDGFADLRDAMQAGVEPSAAGVSGATTEEERAKEQRRRAAVDAARAAALRRCVEVRRRVRGSESANAVRLVDAAVRGLHAAQHAAEQRVRVGRAATTQPYARVHQTLFDGRHPPNARR